jgi:hypothetical protein
MNKSESRSGDVEVLTPEQRPHKYSQEEPLCEANANYRIEVLCSTPSQIVNTCRIE